MDGNIFPKDIIGCLHNDEQEPELDAMQQNQAETA